MITEIMNGSILSGSLTKKFFIDVFVASFPRKNELESTWQMREEIMSMTEQGGGEQTDQSAYPADMGVSVYFARIRQIGHSRESEEHLSRFRQIFNSSIILGWYLQIFMQLIRCTSILALSWYHNMCHTTIRLFVVISTWFLVIPLTTSFWLGYGIIIHIYM